MTTAVDTGILLDILRPNPDFVERSAGLIESRSREGPLVICDLVYAELAANFETRDPLDSFLHDAQIRFDPADTSALFLAGRLWRAYRSAGGERERMIADFVIGAHAKLQASRLATRDRGFYRRYFRDLPVVQP